jgi:hypothetical protein
MAAPNGDDEERPKSDAMTTRVRSTAASSRHSTAASSERWPAYEGL